MDWGCVLILCQPLRVLAVLPKDLAAELVDSLRRSLVKPEHPGASEMA